MSVPRSRDALSDTPSALRYDFQRNPENTA